MSRWTCRFPFDMDEVASGFQSLDKKVRSALPDGVERRHILEELHTLEEGTNMILGFLLKATGHRLRDDGSWLKEESTVFQVQSRLTQIQPQEQ